MNKNFAVKDGVYYTPENILRAVKLYESENGRENFLITAFNTLKEESWIKL